MKSLEKKYILITITMMLAFCSFTFNVNAEETPLSIVCTNSVLADFTSNILIENVTIEYIMPAGACPSHFDTCPSDVSKISSADIIISLGWEPWLESLITSSGNADVEQIKCLELGEWNLPESAKKYVEKIRDDLQLLLPDLNETIETNAQEYLSEIDETAEQLQQTIESNGYLEKEVICMEWQEYFLDWLGLNVTYSYAPPESLSTQDELDVSNAASTGNVFAIIDNLQSGTEFGARIASESGASHIIFTNFPGAVPGTDTYIEMISYNTQQLVNGIATYEYKQGELAELEGRVSSLELERNVSLLGVIIFGLLTVIMMLLYKKK